MVCLAAVLHSLVPGGMLRERKENAPDGGADADRRESAASVFNYPVAHDSVARVDPKYSHALNFTIYMVPCLCSFFVLFCCQALKTPYPASHDLYPVI